jgi:hypothetical protein
LDPAIPQSRTTTPLNQLQPILQRAGAAVTLKPSAYRDGTVGVTGSQNTPATAIPSIVVAAEQYNMLARMAENGQAVTIRVALWSGEEQGLLGARAYIARHLTDQTARDKLAVYLNDDPGSGKTLGFYMEGNGVAKVIFDAWLEPLKELGVTRNIIEGIGSTDHVPFNETGLAGFNVIKDFDAYDARTRHTNADFPERMMEDELKQSAIVLASFAWHAAQRNEKIPRAK